MCFGIVYNANRRKTEENIYKARLDLSLRLEILCNSVETKIKTSWHVVFGMVFELAAGSGTPETMRHVRIAQFMT